MAKKARKAAAREVARGCSLTNPCTRSGLRVGQWTVEGRVKIRLLFGQEKIKGKSKGVKRR